MRNPALDEGIFYRCIQIVIDPDGESEEDTRDISREPITKFFDPKCPYIAEQSIIWYADPTKARAIESAISTLHETISFESLEGKSETLVDLSSELYEISFLQFEIRGNFDKNRHFFRYFATICRRYVDIVDLVERESIDSAPFLFEKLFIYTPSDDMFPFVYPSVFECCLHFPDIIQCRFFERNPREESYERDEAIDPPVSREYETSDRDNE